MMVQRPKAKERSRTTMKSVLYDVNNLPFRYLKSVRFVSSLEAGWFYNRVILAWDGVSFGWVLLGVAEFLRNRSPSP